jgi:hypothetical protein
MLSPIFQNLIQVECFDSPMAYVLTQTARVSFTLIVPNQTLTCKSTKTIAALVGNQLK